MNSSPWGQKESDTTEQLTLSHSLHKSYNEKSFFNLKNYFKEFRQSGLNDEILIIKVVVDLVIEKLTN